MPRRQGRNQGALRATSDGYLVKSLLHASEILWVFQHPGEGLRLRDVMDRTGFGKGMCFRLLYTLRHCGFIEKVDGNRYRLTSEVRRRKRYRIGYASQGQDSSFGEEVHRGLVRAAERERLELIVVDNRYQPKIALKNAELLIRDRVDLVIEFQTDESMAPAIAAKYDEAKIPLIAIDIPHPGATYFGANNYEAGLLAGRYLGKWARQVWNGRVDEILLRGAGPGRVASGVTQSRRHGRHPRSDSRSRGLAGGVDRRRRAIQDGARTRAAAPARRRAPGACWSAAANDPSALGAARAFEEAGRAGDCAIAGQNAEPDARAELRRAADAARGVDRLLSREVRRRLDSARPRHPRRAAPCHPAAFVKHQVITRENVEHFYPNDALMGVETYARH